MGVSAFTNSVCLDFVKRNTGTVIYKYEDASNMKPLSHNQVDQSQNIDNLVWLSEQFGYWRLITLLVDLLTRDSEGQGLNPDLAIIISPIPVHLVRYQPLKLTC